MTGAEVVLDVLRSEGVTHLFGNPGTTELPLMDALSEADDLQYVLALQEATVLGMADAYAQVTRRPAFVNLHTAGGLGNAIGNLVNARANGTPLVITAGQQDERHLAAEPFLSGDLVEIARPLTKWAHEVRTPDELGTMLRRAFADAAAPPAGPVFLSIRMDHLQREAAPAPPRSELALTPTAPKLEQLAEHLCAPAAGRTALICGDEVARAGAVEQVAALAQALGATAFGAPLFGATVFPTGHPLWGGMLPLTSADIRRTLAGFETVLALGAHPFQTILYTEQPALPPQTTLVQLSVDPLAIARELPVRLGVCGDLRASLGELTRLVAARVDRDASARVLADARERRERDDAQRAEQAVALYGDVPLAPLAAAHALMSVVPPDTALVNETPTAGGLVRSFHRANAPGTYYFARGSALGWAMPAACGVALAQPGRPVLCSVGDGATMYSPQALWTAARHRLPILFVVLDNEGYVILRDTMAALGGVSAQSGKYVAMDLEQPRLDFLALARSMGVEASSVASADELRERAAAALAAGEPRLLHVPIGV